jgi:hypothetical protein
MMRATNRIPRSHRGALLAEEVGAGMSEAMIQTTVGRRDEIGLITAD